ncbi:hypothetical protein GCM10009544_02630 [Streptomyces stramineus]|uniref:Uncharacterized protein n=1 Tax=Streptomyces stramineus TaxID=173861 RepID=A0ABN0ZD18_9ACTN
MSRLPAEGADGASRAGEEAVAGSGPGRDAPTDGAADGKGDAAEAVGAVGPLLPGADDGTAGGRCGAGSTYVALNEAHPVAAARDTAMSVHRKALRGNRTEELLCSGRLSGRHGARGKRAPAPPRDSRPTAVTVRS